MLLWEKDNCIISEITERLHLETNTITPLLQRMEKQGLILRQKSEVDNRRRIVSLTSKGKSLEEHMKEIPNCLAREIVDNGMNVEELQNMIPLLDKFILTIKEK